MKGNGSRKSWLKMSPAELARSTRSFDDPNYCPPAVPEPPDLAARHRKAMAALRAKSRRTRGRNAAHIRVTLERSLLQQTDQLANARGINRSEVIAEGLQLLLARG